MNIIRKRGRLLLFQRAKRRGDALTRCFDVIFSFFTLFHTKPFCYYYYYCSIHELIEFNCETHSRNTELTNFQRHATHARRKCECTRLVLARGRRRQDARQLARSYIERRIERFLQI
jgi:hypothetical protein